MESLKNPIRILLVDNDENFREPTAALLNKRGYAVTPVESGELALELVAQGGLTDVVLFELRMKGKNGLSILEELRQLAPKLPIIIMTGRARFTDSFIGRGMEFIDFMQKPIDIERLALRIRDLLYRDESPSRERRLEELIIAESSYSRIYADEPLRNWLGRFRESVFEMIVGNVTGRGHRSVLVFERDDAYLGVLRCSDVIIKLVPEYMGDHPFTGSFTGVFLAQAQTRAQLEVREFVDLRPPLEIEAPLMEAVRLMRHRGVISLPVSRDGELVGIIRDQDLMLELAREVLGDGSDLA